MEHINLFIQEVTKLIGKISAAGQPGVCKFKQGDITGCEAKDFDDSKWKSVMGKGAPINGISTDSFAAKKQEEKLDLCDWSMVDGPAAMRKEIKLEDEFCGISTVGSKLYITLTMLAPLDIYVDGKKAASYKYWGDSRQCEIVITENYKSGNKHVVVFKTPKNDGDAHLGVYFNCSAFEEEILNLSSAVEQLKFAQKLCALYPEKMIETLENLKLDIAAVKKCDFKKIHKTLQNIDKELQPFDKLAKEFKVHLIAHSHLDMNWLWNYEDTVDICTRDFKTICDILDENPDVRFSQSQSCVYDIVQKNDPVTFKRVLEKIKKGVWEVTSATWSEHDLNTSSGETFAQQILSASEYTKNVLKAPTSRVCWEPDTFGHPATVPNILTKAGVEFYYHFRCGTGHTLNWWEGTDGSRVLDYCFGPYNNALRPANLMPAVHDMFDKYGLKTCMFVFGVGDHGGGPTRRDIEIKRYIDKKPCLPKLVFSKVCDFFDEILTLKKDFPVHKGESSFIFEGCYTTKSRIKKLLREGDAKLSDAQAVLAYSMMKDDEIASDAKKLAEAWQSVCFNGFHDISCGCNIKDADEHDFKIGEKAISDAQAIIKKHLKSKSGTKQINVFNQLGFGRTDVVCLKAPKGISGQGFLLDEAENVVPYQVHENNLYFIAEDVPSFCEAVYTYNSKEKLDEENMPVSEAHGIEDGSVYTIESLRHILEISARTGSIVKLHDCFENKNILEEYKGIAEVPGAFKAQKTSNVLKMNYEESHIMSAWVMGNTFKEEYLISPPKIEIVANGVVFTKVKITREFNDSVFTQYITLYSSFDRVDFEADLQFKEKGHYSTGVPVLKVGFTFDVKNPEYIYEIPMGSIKRSVQNAEVPAFRYVAMEDKEKTVALLNDCKHGFYPSGNTMYMTLARNSYSPDACPDSLDVKAKYAISAYYDKECRSIVTRDAIGFNQPLIAYEGDPQEMPLTLPFVFCASPDVVITAIKPSCSKKGIIVRLQECSGKPQIAEIGTALPSESVFEVNLKEEKLNLVKYNEYGDFVNVKMQGNEIKTILFEM